MRTKKRINGLFSHGLSLLAGAGITLALAPFDLWPLAIVSLALLQYLLDDTPPRTSFLTGWLFGLGLFGSGASWVYVSIHEYGNADAPLAVFLTFIFVSGLALLPGFACWLYTRWFSHTNLSRWLAFPACWLLIEWSRSWLLTGFPWLYTGYSLLDTPAVGWAPVVGVTGLGLLIGISASSLYLLTTTTPSRLKSIAIVFSLSLWAAGPLLSTVNWTRQSAPAISVALIQPNIAQQLKWEPEAYRDNISQLQELSSSVKSADLIIWPEAAIPRVYQYASDVSQLEQQKAISGGHTWISGVIWQETIEGKNLHYNSVVAVDESSSVYHKQRLVPFGEYVPLSSLLRGIIDFFNLPMSSMSRGDTDQPLLQAGNLSISPSICYEVVYPDLVASRAANADLLLTLSNDSWFGDSLGPKQHFQMARMRAVENSRYMIRGTNNGISAIINHRGKVQVQGGQFIAEVVTGVATPMKGITPFSRWGSWPTVLLCLCALFIAALRRR
ncbi:MAG: apolipoprotein N-acyltransferase [Pseudomonadales bacterium]